MLLDYSREPRGAGYVPGTNVYVIEDGRGQETYNVATFRGSYHGTQLGHAEAVALAYRITGQSMPSAAALAVPPPPVDALLAAFSPNSHNKVEAAAVLAAYDIVVPAAPVEVEPHLRVAAQAPVHDPVAVAVAGSEPFEADSGLLSDTGQLVVWLVVALAVGLLFRELA